MAFLSHAAGFVPPPPPPPPSAPAAAHPSSYTHAVFCALDDASSRAASHESRDSPCHHPPAAGPPAFADARRYGLAIHTDIHPTTLELAEGLIRMRSSVEPLSAISRDPPPPTPLLPPKKESPSQLHGPADHHPLPEPRPTVSTTSAEDNAARNSDDFSLAENSDTITDPDIDLPQAAAERALPKPPVQALHAPGFHALHEVATAAARSQAIPKTTTQSPPLLEHGPNQAFNMTPHHGLANLYESEAKPQKPYDPAAPIVPLHDVHCCCRQVADVYINILDEKEPADAAMLTKLYAACKDDLCPRHLDAYAALLTKAMADVSTAEFETEAEPPWTIDFTVGHTGTGTRWVPGPRRRRRATSIPGIDEFEFDLPPKRRRVLPTRRCSPRAVFTNGSAWERPQAEMLPPAPAPWPTQTPCRPSLDADFNEDFRHRVLFELAQSFTDRKEDDWSRGETTNRYIHAILSKCEPPNTNLLHGPVDAGFLSGDEAAAVIEKGGETIPLFTEGQQQFQWTDSHRRPIAQLFHRMEDLTREVSVQIPSHNFDLPSYKTKSLEDVRDRFMAGYASQDPWNILDLRSPLPPAILPKFLTGENCQLLPRIRDALLEGHSAERTKASREDWNEWTELLEWVLMSEGGHNTAPHMDSHGWSTWITIQEGHFGFGWLSRPTAEEQDAWMKDPLAYTGGNWRFVILKPGQTVFFPSGTIHFVFRLREEQTLALGGHLLQWTALERWVQVILYQLKNPNITNEDLGNAPLKYVRTARKLVDNRMANSRLGTMGGMAAVTRFMVLSNVGSLLTHLFTCISFHFFFSYIYIYIHILCCSSGRESKRDKNAD